MTKTIPASEVREGMTVSALRYKMATGLLRRTRMRTDHLRKRRGQWPTVVEADFWEQGEGGEPTVYLVLSDDTSGCYPLHPGEMVTVEEPS